MNNEILEKDLSYEFSIEGIRFFSIPSLGNSIEDKEKPKSSNISEIRDCNNSLIGGESISDDNKTNNF